MTTKVYIVGEKPSNWYDIVDENDNFVATVTTLPRELYELYKDADKELLEPGVHKSEEDGDVVYDVILDLPNEIKSDSAIRRAIHRINTNFDEDYVYSGNYYEENSR